jgi:UDP-glucose 4-epimerase
MRRILITGGSGFVGRNLVEQLRDDYDVTAPSSRELDLLDEGSVRGYLSAGRFDVVVHTATWNATRNSSKDTALVLPNNLRMYYNVARCSDAFGKMLYFGSGAEFDRRSYRPLMREEYFDATVPADDYGFSKYVMATHAEGSRNIYNLRLFGVFGPHEDWEIRFISNACCKALWELPITLRQNVRFDYLFVDDLARLTRWFIDHTPRHHTYNVCTGEAVDLVTLAEIVREISGRQLPIVAANPGMGREYSGDNRRLLAEIGDFRFTPHADAIRSLYQWYAARRELIDPRLLLTDK